MSKQSDFNVRNIRFDVAKVQHVREPQEWRDIQQLVRTALGAALPEGRQGENGLDHVVPKDLYAFRNSRLHPQISFPGQSFHLKRVVRAYEHIDDGNESLVGYLGFADNTSGSVVKRLGKMWMPPSIDVPQIFPNVVQQFAHKRYVHLREIAVKPSAQHRGIAHIMTWLALRDKPDIQPVAAYSWESELPHMPGILNLIGMHVTDRSLREMYGSGQSAVEMQRWVGEAGVMSDSIRDMPGAFWAIKTALTTLDSNLDA